MRVLWLWLLAPGCIGLLPFRNEPPRLLSANGVKIPRLNDYAFVPDPLDDGVLELELELEDPERHDVRVWFPFVEGEYDFDPDGTTGTFFVPEWATNYQLFVVLEDDRDPPARSGWSLQFNLPYADTGGSGAP